MKYCKKCFGRRYIYDVANPQYQYVCDGCCEHTKGFKYNAVVGGMICSNGCGFSLPVNRLRLSICRSLVRKPGVRHGLRLRYVQ